MSWRSALSRTRQRQRNTMVNSEMWGRGNQQGSKMPMPEETDQIGMHVRVLRYHEIRLGNIEKQLATLSRQLSNLGTSSTHPKNTKHKTPTNKHNNTETVTQLQGVLKNLAEEVASSNKMIKQFITGDKVGFKEENLNNRESIQPKIENKINERDTMEWKLAKARLVRCGIRATDERIRDMVLTMKEEVNLVADILENHTENLEKSVEKAVIETVSTVSHDESKQEENKSLETVVLSDTSEDNDEEETIDISTSKDIGYVPVHVVVKKKRGRPKKKKTNAK